MNDSAVNNWDYPDEPKQYSPEYFRDWMRRVVNRVYAQIDEEKNLAQTHDYIQVWLMSKKQWESLPDNAIWSDMIEAGGQFIGYEWVEKTEDERELA